MHGDEDDRMILVSVVIIDCVIFMYIGCVQHTFFSSQCATNTNHMARSHAVGKSAGSSYKANSHRISPDSPTAHDEAQTRGIASHRHRQHLRVAAHRAAGCSWWLRIAPPLVDLSMGQPCVRTLFDQSYIQRVSPAYARACPTPQAGILDACS